MPKRIRPKPVLKKIFPAPKKIRKRDGRIVDFDWTRIADAIFKAFEAKGEPNRQAAEETARRVVEKLARKYRNKSKAVPGIEEVQDLVEETLIEKGFAKIAKAYILYREKRAEIRREKQLILDKTEIDEVDKRFDLNALRVLKSRYLRKDPHARVIESPKQLFQRVAIHAGLPEIIYDQRVSQKTAAKKPKENFTEPLSRDGALALGRGYKIGQYELNPFHLQGLSRLFSRFDKEGKTKITWKELLKKLKNNEFENHSKTIDQFYQLMISRRFMPNTPAIANFGNYLGMGSACFALDIDDSIESIMGALTEAAIVFKSGGGLGYNFSKLRPEGDFIKTTGGTSSGPLSFMRLFDTMTEVVKQGGIRRGANMGIMNSNHPDIEKFVSSKEQNKSLKNFNISVMLMSDFWEYLKKDKPYPLINPRTGQVVREISPRLLFDNIAYHAWESGEPGVVFHDTINKYNPFLAELGPIQTTNPCVTGDTLVSTNRGLERIEELEKRTITVDNRAVLCVKEKERELAGILSTVKNSETSLMRWQKEKTLPSRGVSLGEATAVFESGIKDVYKLETKSGYEIQATFDHKFFTPQGMMELGTLQIGSKLYIQSGEGSWNKEQKLPFEPQNFVLGRNGRMYNFNFPSRWSRELGWALGWLAGDGWLSQKNHCVGWVFSDKDDEVRLKLQPIIEEYLNRKIEAKYNTLGVKRLTTSSRKAVEFFQKIGVLDSAVFREVPKTIFTAPKEAVVGFIEGLFSSDGTIGCGTKSRNYLRLNSSSLKLLKQVQLLLLNFGIRSAIFDRSTEPKVFRYKKSDGEIVQYRTSGVNYELNISKENLANFAKTFNFLQTEKNQKLKRLTENFEFYREYFIEEVASIIHLGKARVWDLTEAVSHSFIGNGFVIKNCGEVILYPNESCNLGSINLWAFLKENGKEKKFIDWKSLEETIHTATKFLDNVIDINVFPLPKIEEMSLKTRKIGLGVMGIGDAFFSLQTSFNSPKGRELMEKIMEFVNYHSKVKSVAIAKERGSFPYFEKSFFKDGKMPFSGFYDKKSWSLDWEKLSEDIKRHGLRNGYTTVIAPTGSISMIAGCSSGIEPVYALVFKKNVAVGSFYYIDPVFEKAMLREGLFDEVLIEHIAENNGSLQKISYIPPAFKKVFVTAHDISPDDHIRTLAAFQKWTDSSISKTNNFPARASVEDVKKSYILAHELGCKAVTVFRDKSIKNQVLVSDEKAAPSKTGRAGEPSELVRMKDEKAEGFSVYHNPAVANPFVNGNGNGNVGLNGAGKSVTKCPSCQADLSHQEGCVSCPICGWGLCV